MGNTITIELCAEDRARLDRLAVALENKACDKCVTAAVEYIKSATAPVAAPQEPKEEPIPVEENPAPPKAEKNISTAELRAKFIALSAKGLKQQAADVVKAYAPTIPSVPEDKIAECYEKLVALEGNA